MKKILIVVDMQKDFVDGALGTEEAQAIVGNVVKKKNNFCGDIFVTYDTHCENYMETMEGKNLPVKHCIKDTPGWELDLRVKNALEGKKYTAVEKPTFGSAMLPEIIRDRYNINETEIELIGLCTDICVISNALMLKAHFPEMKITVDESCCAGVTPDKHNAAIEVMRSCQLI